MNYFNQEGKLIEDVYGIADRKRFPGRVCYELPEDFEQQMEKLLEDGAFNVKSDIMILHKALTSYMFIEAGTDIRDELDDYPELKARFKEAK